MNDDGKALKSETCVVANFGDVEGGLVGKLGRSIREKKVHDKEGSQIFQVSGWVTEVGEAVDQSW